MDNNFTKQVQDWLNTPSAERDYEHGAMLLLKLNGNQIMYRNLTMRRTKKGEEFIEYQLKKRLTFRLKQVTHEQVEQMQKQVDGIVVKRNLEKQASKPTSEFKTGKRADHDKLPEEIQALYVENLSIVQKMRELHLKLRSLSLENATCPDSERYPFLKELISLDKKLHSNWEAYDHYTGADGEQVMTEDLREQSKQAVRMINLNKNRYAKKPSEELKSKILAWYGKVINPTDKLTAELKNIGVIE
ncbi:MAG: hypothetical protein IKX31_07240 [Muribaculaceae bacterium]|nr:hypothetical protein [Muribaculaceae bacterium]MBR5086784.1 hypothetical protein [Muribaculaceae bacterium]